MFNRPISWLAVLQLFAILLGHAGSVLGEAWCKKFRLIVFIVTGALALLNPLSYIGY